MDFVKSRLSKELLFVVILISVFIYISYTSFMLFHIGVEFFSIAIAFAMFVIVINVDKFSENDYFIFLGIAYGFIAGFDLLHTLSYEGMGIFSNHTANLPTQLWIISRYLESISLLVAIIFLKRKIDKTKVIAIYSLLAVLLLLSVFWWGIFPDCLIAGEGLTLFKKVSEYIISSIILITLALVYYNREKFYQKTYIYMVLSLLSTAVAELFFTFYVSVYGISNIAGHLLKIASFYFIYKSIIEINLRKPYSSLFSEINQAKTNLESKNDELENVIYAISHDIRSPLVNIRGFSKEIEFSVEELRNLISESSISGPIKDDLEEIIDEQIPDSLNYIVDSVNNVDGLLKGLLKLSRIDSNELALKRIDANQKLDEVVANYKYKIQEEKIDIEVSDLPNCQADEVQFMQIFSNLIENAIKYSQSDTISRIKVSGWEEKEEIVYSVADNGIGISEENQNQIFRIFNRASTEIADGEGLGLALVKKIVDRHHGEIWLESELGVGSEFFISFPKYD
ncbi:MAG: MASE3 domain-containing protein [Bacillota bacterium]